MYSIIKEIPISGAVIAITVGNKFFYIVDNTYNIYFLDKGTLEVTKNFNVSSDYEPLHKFSHAHSVSKSGFINLGIALKSNSIILSTTNGIKKVKIIDNHNKDIECSAFSNNNQLLATGGEDGKVFIFNLSFMKMIIALANRPDYISSLKFSDDDRYLITNCYDKTSFIYNVETGKYDYELHSLPDVVEESQFFDNNTKVHYICRNGRSLIYDLNSDTITHNDKLFDSWPTASVLIYNKKYLLVGTRTSTLYAIKLETNTKVFEIELHALGVSSLEITNEYLLVGFSDGNLSFINYKDGLADLEIYLKAKDYLKAQNIFEQNIFLTIHRYMDDFFNAWPEVLKEAISMISRKQIVQAIEYVAPFVKDESRAEEFKFYTTQIDDINRLHELIKSKKYIQAMVHVDDKPFLKKLSANTKLEEYWVLIFNRIKEMIATDPEYNKTKIQDILRQFLVVPSKKNIADSMMKNYEKILEAEGAIRERKIKDFYKIANKYEFIQETDIYSKVGVMGDRVYSKVMSLEQKGDYDKALDSLDSLKQFDPYTDKARELNKDIKGKQQFVNAINAGDLRKAYSILQRYPNARYLKEYTTLTQDFDDKIEEATKHSLKGDPSSASEILDEYLHIAYTVDKSAAVIKLGFLHEIEKSIAVEAKIDWHKSINAFINLFGVDSELEYSCRKVPSAFDEYIATTNEGKTDGYRKLNIPESILFFK